MPQKSKNNKLNTMAKYGARYKLHRVYIIKWKPLALVRTDPCEDGIKTLASELPKLFYIDVQVFAKKKEKRRGSLFRFARTSIPGKTIISGEVEIERARVMEMNSASADNAHLSRNAKELAKLLPRTRNNSYRPALAQDRPLYDIT